MLNKNNGNGSNDRHDQEESIFRDVWRRVGQVYFQSVKDLFNDNGPQWAAAIAYYSLLSIFPLILAAASIAAFFMDPEWAISQVTQLLENYLPQAAGEVDEIIREAIDARQTVSIISIALLLWGGSRVFGVVTRALNIAYDVDEPYGFIKRTLVEMVMLLTIGILFILALAAPWLINLFRNVFNLLAIDDNIFLQVILDVAPAILLFIAFFLTYLLVPRRSVDWRAAMAGGMQSTLLFVVARPLFIQYVQNFASYNLIYGSVAIVIILIIWAYIVALILLFGGEVVSHIQMMLIEGLSAEQVEKRHRIRSPWVTESGGETSSSVVSGERDYQRSNPKMRFQEKVGREQRTVTIPLIPFLVLIFLSAGVVIWKIISKE